MLWGPEGACLDLVGGHARGKRDPFVVGVGEGKVRENPPQILRWTGATGLNVK